MNIDSALSDLGVTENSLTDEERGHLDRDGYLLLSGILTPAAVERTARRLADLFDQEGSAAGTETDLEAGVPRLANLVDKDVLEEDLLFHPRVIAGVAHVLNRNMKLSSFNCRVALPGTGEQEIHPDWGEPVAVGDYYACNSIWCIDDFTAWNGSTRVIPGTHRSERMPPRPKSAEWAGLPQARQVTAPAGSAIVLNGHLWHSGTLNRSTASRRAMHGYFVRRSEPQQQDQDRLLSAATKAKLSPAARYLLDVGPAVS